ncbi:MAG: 50S ribosomal protein L24 [Syntrophus sp. SKADARSKE-3]|nr:50S ribosomal protein L24 [Syntrophus sp. SKADARSKE-3]
MENKRLKKGDMVKVLTGKERGKTGKVLKTMRSEGKVVIEKLNFVKKHQRPDAKGKGGIVEKEGPIHLSNVAYLCSKCNAGVRIGYKEIEGGKKVRICMKCKDQLDS